MPTDAQNAFSVFHGHPKSGMPTETQNEAFYAWGLPTAESRTGFLELRPLVGDRFKKRKPRFSHCENPEFCHAMKTS